ncbi:hypothetical protein DNH61_16695 [Paenibacillus sambharensis]|uniref:RsgI N-terminal anti-sigma domain-containing protein n=1 Tax=Paenibacillus sambharensis TaxID=1803190 RepID=A0A2W1LHS1_9BACL|nr:anti-sigma factor domain-containing protein [Paenibacillus sambharensis]PZD94602.1 hypothetical protein DNH61_16695 [Paenibacillus sambharensis]
MKRGIVVEINPRYSIVLTPDGEYKRVAAGDYRIGEEISLQDVRRRRSRGMLWSCTAAVMVILVLLIPNLWPAASAEPAVYVTMDINPSIEMGLSVQGKVVSLSGLNEDGQRIVDGMAYEGQPVQQVTASIMKRVCDLEYLSGTDNTVLITGMAVGGRDSGQVEEKLTSLVDEAVKTAAVNDSQERSDARIINVQVTRLMAPEELREASIESGLSPGKMAVFLLAEANGYSIDLSELKERSISQIAAQLGGLEKVMGGDADGSYHLNDLKKLLSLPVRGVTDSVAPEEPEADGKLSDESSGRTETQQTSAPSNGDKLDRQDKEDEQDKKEEKDTKKDMRKEKNKEKDKEKETGSDKKEDQAAETAPGSKTADKAKPDETGKAAKAEKEDGTSSKAGNTKKDQAGTSSQPGNSGSKGSNSKVSSPGQSKQAEEAGAKVQTEQTDKADSGTPAGEKEGEGSKAASSGSSGKEAKGGKQADAGSPSSSAQPKPHQAEQKPGQREAKEQKEAEKQAGKEKQKPSQKQEVPAAAAGQDRAKSAQAAGREGGAPAKSKPESTSPSGGDGAAPVPAAASGAPSADKAGSSSSTQGPAAEATGGSPGSAQEPAGKAKNDSKAKNK